MQIIYAFKTRFKNLQLYEVRHMVRDHWDNEEKGIYIYTNMVVHSLGPYSQKM